MRALVNRKPVECRPFWCVPHHNQVVLSPWLAHGLSCFFHPLLQTFFEQAHLMDFFPCKKGKGKPSPLLPKKCEYMFPVDSALLCSEKETWNAFIGYVRSPSNSLYFNQTRHSCLGLSFESLFQLFLFTQMFTYLSALDMWIIFTSIFTNGSM